ncbi:Alpha/Beta hydrolase protein [Apiospora marii]|uniref:Alpha/Beta hydrolase protein n=1 Tax=Apiospora marii TaxID=335849 RepID=A0ABR1R9B8_9PEZI
MASFPSTTCIVCLNPKAALCARCKAANYCSPACQKADYPVHKAFCRDFPNHPRDPKKHRAFVFEPVKDAPRIVNHACDHSIPTGYDNGGPHPDLVFKRVARVIGSAYLRLPADQYDTLDYFIITTNVRTGLKLKHTLVLFSRKDGGLQYADRGGKTNDPGDDIRMGFRCWTLSNLVSKAYDQADYDLFGPFMLCSFDAQDGAPRDTTLEDLRHLVDYLGLCEQTRAEEWAQHHHALWLALHGDERVNRLIEGRVFVPTRAHPEIDYPDSANMGGLELHCANDMIVHKLPAMTPIGVTPSSPLWQSQSCGSVSPLSEMAGMPGTVPDEWAGNSGNVTLIHHYGVTPDFWGTSDLMGLCAYALAEVQPRVRAARKIGTSEAREEVMEFISKPANFSRYFARWNYKHGSNVETTLQTFVEQERRKEGV